MATKLVMAADHRENQRRRKGPSWGFRVQDGDLGCFFGVYRVQVGGLVSKLEVLDAFLGCILGRAPVGVWESQRQLGRGLEGLGLAQGRLGTRKWDQHGPNLNKVGFNLGPT